MKTLNDYKRSYTRAVKSETKSRIMNSAMLNLSHEDQQKFVAWQVKYMNK